MMNLDFLELGDRDYNKIVVFVHGWKGNKDSFKAIASIMKIPKVKWLFPQAPYKMSDKNEEYSWAFENSDGIFETKKTVDLFGRFLEENILSMIDSRKVFFIGFSQGATMCYDFILQLKYPWGGVFPVAGFKRNSESVFKIHKNQQSTPIVIGHGLKDDVIPIASSENIYKELKNSNCNVSFEKFGGRHKISIDYLKKIRSIINE